MLIPSDGHLFPADFLTKILYVFLIFSIPRPFHPTWIDHLNSVYEVKVKFLCLNKQQAMKTSEGLAV